MENKKPRPAPSQGVSAHAGLTPLPAGSPLDGLAPLAGNDPFANLSPLANNDPLAGLTPIAVPQASAVPKPINGLAPISPPTRPTRAKPVSPKPVPVDGLTPLSPPAAPEPRSRKAFRGAPRDSKPTSPAVAHPLAGLTPLHSPPGASLDPFTSGGVFPDLDSLDPLASANAKRQEELDEVDAAAQRMMMWRVLPAVGTSSLLHAIVVLVMAFVTLTSAEPSQDVVVVASETTEEIPDLDALFDPEIDEMKLDEDFGADDSNSSAAEALSKFEISQAAEIFDAGDFQAGSETVMSFGGGFDGTIFAGRSEENKKELLKKSGGSSVTEKAVNNALKWFAKHQAEDGSWNFDHKLDNAAKKCVCSKPGDLVDCRTGATAMALLPFLGAGHTPQSGPYRQNVEKGLYYLVSQLKVEDGNRGNLAQGGGSMYSHGLAAITLCEAYAMTKDKGLKEPAQLALNHTVYAQATDGGWRYAPKQMGDTSAVGWQLMALKSGRMGYLDVPDSCFVNAGRFLDAMQTKQGSHYGYDKPGEGEATTAVGLLCRMYTGWAKDHPPLKAGAKWISDRGPSKTSMYYNYYATQVMRHLDDQNQWPKWNREMRSMLTDSQEDNEIKHSFGSWYFKGDPFADRGGRLYHTSLATMILEVYYRHLPIYSDEAAKLETFK